MHYKLRATAVRSGFAITHRDLTALFPITIMRGFGPEALEYQQTLEIENTWPEKLMYSIMIPHKAWAAGEKVTAVVKFSPIVKGARVLNVTTTINETVKLYTRSGMQESTRMISSTRHDIADGKAVCVDEQHHRYRIPLLHHNGHHISHRHTASMPATPANGLVQHNDGPSAASSGYFPASPSHPPSPQRHTTDLAQLTTTTTNSSQSSGDGTTQTNPAPTQQSSSGSSSENLPHTPPPPPLSALVDPQDAEFMEPSVDVVTTLNIGVPIHATPSHSLEVCSPVVKLAVKLQSYPAPAHPGITPDTVVNPHWQSRWPHLRAPVLITPAHPRQSTIRGGTSSDTPYTADLARTPRRRGRYRGGHARRRGGGRYGSPLVSVARSRPSRKRVSA